MFLILIHETPTFFPSNTMLKSIKLYILVPPNASSMFTLEDLVSWEMFSQTKASWPQEPILRPSMFSYVNLQKSLLPYLVHHHRKKHLDIDSVRISVYYTNLKA